MIEIINTYKKYDNILNISIIFIDLTRIKKIYLLINYFNVILWQRKMIRSACL